MKKSTTNNPEEIKLKCILYGASGAGKTYSALTLDPAKTLIVSAEAGLLPLTGKPFDVEEIASWKEFRNVGAALKTDEYQKKYETIFIDSLTEIAELLKVHIVTNERPKTRGTVSKVYDDQLDIKDWGLYTDMMKRYIRGFRNLPYNIIFTALEEKMKDENSGDILFTVLLPGKKIVEMLPGYFDCVFRLVIKRGSEESERYFLTSNDGKSVGKDRSGNLSRLELPDWKSVMQKIKDGYKDNKEKK